MRQNFPGYSAPSVSFQQVRDNRRSPLEMYDVDLSVARSFAAATQLDLPLAGNLFYIDQDPAISGFATIAFGDGNGAGPTKVYVGPGFAVGETFTSIQIANLAQPGKVLRIIFGTDVDFQPRFGSIQNVNVAAGSVNVTDQLNTATSVAGFVNLTEGFNVATGQYVVPLIIPGTGTYTIKNISGYAIASATASINTFLIAAAVAPAAPLSNGSNRYSFAQMFSSNTNSIFYNDSKVPRIMPAGWGLWVVASIVGATCSYQWVVST